MIEGLILRLFTPILRKLIRRIVNLEFRLERLERKWEREMAKDRDALKELDAQLDALEAYVRSDEETDAAEVNLRADRVRQLLASVHGAEEVPVEDVAEREQRLADVADEAAAQTEPPAEPQP